MWERFGEERGIHLIKWDVVSRSKEKRGLSIGNLVKRNSALLGKWLFFERNSLWPAIIKSKYGLHPNSWDMNLVSYSSH